MIVGNLSALRQTNIVRLLAYSSIAQAGFMLVPFAAAGVAGTDLTDAFSATVIYLVIFAVMNLGAFAVVIAGARRDRNRRHQRLGGSRLLRPEARSPGGRFLLLAGRDPTAGRLVRQVRDVPVGDRSPAARPPLCWLSSPRSTLSSPSTTTPGSSSRSGSIRPRRVHPDADRAPVPAGSLRLALLIASGLTVIVGIFPTLASIFGDASRVLAAG